MALWVTTADPVELRPNASEADLQAVIRAVYRQVLGNQHIMESQRLTSAESLLRNGDITVRGFVQQVALSDLYRSLFFENSSPYRFIELNFKHLLGRAPSDQTEISEHVQRYHAQGYEVEIQSYLDSREYQLNFGEQVVPYVRGNQSQTGATNVSFNRIFALERGFAASDTGKEARLVGEIAANRPTKITAPRGGGAYNNRAKRFRITIAKASYGPRVGRSNLTVEVGYDQLSQRLQSIQKSGGRVVSVSEVA